MYSVKDDDKLYCFDLINVL